MGLSGGEEERPLAVFRSTTPPHAGGEPDAGGGSTIGEWRVKQAGQQASPSPGGAISDKRIECGCRLRHRPV